jgi:hypothetical protein
MQPMRELIRILAKSSGALAALTVAMTMFLSGPAAFAACDPGWSPTVSGGCMPPGARDCGAGRGYCSAGTSCMAVNGCMPAGAVDCGGGRGYCDPGMTCMRGSGCMPPGAVDCGDGGYCTAGTVCTGNGKCSKP